MNDSPPDHSDSLAVMQMESAIHRTLLAEQRTYSAWVRTGLTSSATGFAIAKLMTETEPAWLVRCLAILFLSTGACMFLLAFWAYRNALSKLSVGTAGGIPSWILAMMSLALLIAAVMGLYLIL